MWASMAEGPVSYHTGDKPQDNEKTAATNEQAAQMEQAYAQMRRKMRMEEMDKSIKHKIMVLSGKGLSLIHISEPTRPY